jgi:hypothetical protein
MGFASQKKVEFDSVLCTRAAVFVPDVLAPWMNTYIWMLHREKRETGQERIQISPECKQPSTNNSTLRKFIYFNKLEKV